MNNRDTLRQIAVISGLVATVIFNGLSQLGAFGLTNDVIANSYPDLLYFPANAAFSIWGVIYSFLIAYAVYQALPAQKEHLQLRSIGYAFVFSCIMNCGWIVAFAALNFPLSMMFMLGLLASLLFIYIRLEVGVKAVSRADKWLIHVPFSIYLGWITAATVANAAYLLTDAGWDGFGIANETWAVIMLLVTGVIGALVTYTRKDIAYGLVIVWATGWIAARYTGTEFALTTAFASGVAVVVAVVIVAAVVLRLRPSGLSATR